MKVKLAMILVISSIAVIFVAQNITVVTVDFLVWGFSMPGSLLIILTMLSGFLLGWFVHGYIAYRKSRDTYEYLS